MAYALDLAFDIPPAWGYLICALVVLPLVTHGVTVISRLQVWTQPLWILLLVVPYVGDPFEYDIFVSYAHAESATETPLIHEWSQYVAGRLRDRLASALNPTVGDEAKVAMFLDDRVLVSGERLTDLEKRARHSAVLLVLMSPLYPKRPYCLEELEAFFTQADADGRSQRHSVVLRIQPLSREDWPVEAHVPTRGVAGALTDLGDRVGIGVREGAVQVLLAARERADGALRVRGAPARRRRRVLEAAQGVLAEAAEDCRLPVARPVLNATFEVEPVVRENGIGSPPISAPTCGGGQSWLVGYSG